MTAEVVTLVRLPIAEAVEMLRQKHDISEAFSEVRLEDEFLAFYFVRSAGVKRGGASPRIEESSPGERTIQSTRRRRARKRRNRMKTRGWPVVTKIQNKKGQTAVIYKPFVDALTREGLSKRDQRIAVEEILRANGNKPSKNSVLYFLENTTEYLNRHRIEGSLAGA